MAFLICRISTTADGREIARTTPVDKEILTIGRAAENDIELQDLAVDPLHARIEQRDDRRIAIIAEGTLGFEVDGRTSRRADINSAKGAELRFGGHRIMVSRDDEGRILLTVQRVAALSEAAEDRDEAVAFSLRRMLPGKRPTAWLLALGLLIAFLAVPIWGFFNRPAQDQRSVYALKADHNWSSGPLSQAHHALEGNCTACHQQAFVSVRDSSCTSCHKDVHDHAPPRRLAAARMPPALGGRVLASIARAFGKPGPGACVDCHNEHEGAGPMPPTAQAFCADCHGSLKRRLADSKIADAGDFGTSHPQFRPLVATIPGDPPVMHRVSLDARPTDDSGLKFPHKLHLDPRGGVARMGQTLKARFGYGDALVCADCHMPSADGTRFVPVTMEKNCQGCHSLAFEKIGGTVRTLRHGDTAQTIADLRAYFRSTGPVRPINLGGNSRRLPGDRAEQAAQSVYAGAVATRATGADAAIKAVFAPRGACGECHVVTPPASPASDDWRITKVNQPMRYLMHGWFDHNAHTTETCSSCHAASQSTRASDLLLPGIKSCRSCHGGETSASKVPSGCSMCHSYHVKQDAPWTSRQRLSPASRALSPALTAIRPQKTVAD